MAEQNISFLIGELLVLGFVICWLQWHNYHHELCLMGIANEENVGDDFDVGIFTASFGSRS
jgi:hypothetical protein